MILLLFTLLAAAAVAGLVLAPGRDWPRWIDDGLVVALAFLPLAFAASVLVGSLGELGVLRIEPVGKRLVFGPGLPVTIGGSSADSEDFEDLHAGALSSLPAAVVRLEEWEEGGLRLALESPSPIVRLIDLGAQDGGDGNGGETRVLNAVALADQDQIVLAGGAEPYTKLVFQDRALGAPRLVLSGDGAGEGDRPLRLDADPGLVYLPDALAQLGVEMAPGERYVSAFERVDGDWRLLLREDTVELKSTDGETRRFVRDHPVGNDLRLELQVVWTANNERILRTVRSDRLRVGDGQVEVRYGETELLAAELPTETDGRGRLALAVVVPEISEERATVELPDASPRFRGLSALLEVDEDGEATISHLGQTEPLEFGQVYGLGEGLGDDGADGAEDRLLVRIDRERFPWFLLLDLALLSVYFLVFLGRMMRIDGALAALVGSVGLLLACRLLFAYRAAARPPDFATGVLTEARVALWVVPGLLVGFYAFAWLVARFSTRPGDRLVRRYRVAWPLGGVAVAILGLRLVGGGWGLVVPLLAVGLVVAFLAMAPGRRYWAQRVERLQRRGVPWQWWTPLAVGGAILVVRFLFDLLGMPETLRFPGGGRLLWTVFQIPVSVVVVALSLHHLDQLWRTPGPDAARQLLLGVLALLGFLATAFLAVALLVDDTGLVIAQALPYVLAVVCLLGVPALWRSRQGASVDDEPAGAGLGLRLAAAVLLVLPAVGVVWMNLLPEQAMAVGTTLAGGGDGVASFDQRLYRLYMLSDPGLLRDFGLVASERMAVHYETLQDYARLGGWTGAGYLATDLPRYLGATYLSDLVPMVFVLPEMGRLGLLGLVLLYLVPLLGLAFFAAPAGGPSTGRGPLVRQALWLALVALLAFAVPSLFMVLGNLNMALFTGKNLSLLGINSLSDVLEAGLVLGLAVTGLVLRMMPEVPRDPEADETAEPGGAP